jgi:hypothetical protein
VQFPELPLANIQTRRDMSGIIGQLTAGVKRRGRRREENIEHPTSNGRIPSDVDVESSIFDVHFSLFLKTPCDPAGHGLRCAYAGIVPDG